jgi:predicted negative regulator of RcsB-dependent stress response
MSKLKFQRKNTAVLVAIIVLIIFGVIAWNRQQNGQITNYDECVAAGNPIMESFPEQCSANGRTFINTSYRE